MRLQLLLFYVPLIVISYGKPLAEEPPVCGYEACPFAGLDTLNVHLIPHSHLEVGWLKTPEEYYVEDVQQILSSVVEALDKNPDRKFIQVETAFFKRWWDDQTDEVKQTVQKLVNNGQFEFTNGAWTMNDEATVYYQSTIDQFTLGLRYIQDLFGPCARPKVAWQIDSFGHSREQASIAAHMGFDSMFFARLDYRDKERRLNESAMDLLWQGSDSLGNSSDLFTSVLYNNYTSPPGFCFDSLCDDEPIIDDEADANYNLERRVQEFADYVREMAGHYVSNNVLVTMGGNFNYTVAESNYKNLDLLIGGFEKFQQDYDGKRINVFYSTPSCYTKAVNDYVNYNSYELEMKYDDFFAYADAPYTYYTGYFSSRPVSKRLERIGNNLLQVFKQLGANLKLPYNNETLNSFKEAMGVMQHHNAITGTSKQHVDDYYRTMLTKVINNSSAKAGAMIANIISNSDEDFEFMSCLLANVSICSESNADKFTLAVYNSLSRMTTTFISVPIYDRTNWNILDPNGNSVEYQIEDSITDFSYIKGENTSKTVLLFAAKDIPAMGYNVYRFESTNSVKDIKKEPTATPDYVGYENTNFEINENTGLVSAITMNGYRLVTSQGFFYYSSKNFSGAYNFAPVPNILRSIASDSVNAKIIRGDVYQGVVQEFSPWVKQIIRIYKEDTSFIEFDWIVGPIDITDYVGKEVVMQFNSWIANNGFFNTYSNGREFIRRWRNYRPTYRYTFEDTTAGTYFPISNRILMSDVHDWQDVGLAVITDRPQGGSSLANGQLELMVHRACQHDDGRGLEENLNEQEYGQGVIVRGKHYIMVAPSTGNGEKSFAALQRDLALRKTLHPWTFYTKKDVTSSLNILQFSALKQPVPENVHILTLEPWNENTVLLRLEHYIQKEEDENLSKEVAVDVSQLFTLFVITELQETTLGANMPIEESVRLHWPGSVNNDTSTNADVNDLIVVLQPMQIRTFWATVLYL